MGRVNDMDGLYEMGHRQGFEAGVQAERDRIEREIKAIDTPLDTQPGFVTFRAALAVVTGKEGAA